MDFSLFEAQKFTSAVKYIDTGLAEGRADAGIVLCNVIKYIKHIYWLGQGEILFQTHEYTSNIKFI